MRCGFCVGMSSSLLLLTRCRRRYCCCWRKREGRVNLADFTGRHCPENDADRIFPDLWRPTADCARGVTSGRNRGADRSSREVAVVTTGWAVVDRSRAVVDRLFHIHRCGLVVDRWGRLPCKPAAVAHKPAGRRPVAASRTPAGCWLIDCRANDGRADDRAKYRRTFPAATAMGFCLACDSEGADQQGHVGILRIMMIPRFFAPALVSAIDPRIVAGILLRQRFSKNQHSRRVNFV